MYICIYVILIYVIYIYTLNYKRLIYTHTQHKLGQPYFNQRCELGAARPRGSSLGYRKPKLSKVNTALFKDMEVS